MKRILSALLSITIIVTSFASAFAEPSDIPFEERPFTADAAAVAQAIDTLTADLKKSGNYNKVLEDYTALLEVASAVDSVMALNMAETEKLNYGIKTPHTREELDENYDAAFKLNNDINMAVKSILKSPYAAKFKERWGEERTAMVEAYEEETDDTYKQFYDRYYDMAANGAEGKEFAKLLKEVILYCRTEGDDISVETDFNKQIEYCENVTDYYYYLNKFKNYAAYKGLDKISGVTEFENPLEALAVVGNIDDRLKTAYEYLIRNNLCSFTDSGEHFAGTTYGLSAYGDSEMVVAGDKDVIGTLIHEFGHFQQSLGIDADAEEGFFRKDIDALAEVDSQTLALMAFDCYDDIYGENADAMRFQTLMSSLYTITDTAGLTIYELSLYNMDIENMSDAELNEYMTNIFGDEWYTMCRFYFILPGRYIQYSLTMLAAVQIYDLYLNDREAGLQKYFEACSYTSGTYDELMDKLGLVSASDDNVLEVLETATDNIFKSLYDIDYKTALDYFENRTYLGRVFPTVQKVSVNGKAPQTLYAYNGSGCNYIGIRDLAKLLNGTSAQFDVTYDAETATVNMLTDKAYTPDGSELNDIPDVVTAGQKAAGTYELQRNGETVYAGGMVFVNGRNYFLLRGIAENNLLNIDVDYDAANNTVLITTK